ncbi:MAG: hypothetical protein GTO60_07850, partial [Gammaproteobacteria bacterium]|nr:hypothetical protein [Gammaproteobacteria bacterium]NIO62419.1 hypothetical protein [Gammaproteobacteria bacterium]
NLPFELSYTPDIGYFFQQERINLSRFVFEETEPLSAEMERLAPPPLKILVVVSAPDDLKEHEKMLDYEREQELIIEALNPLLEHHIAQVHFRG